MNILTKAAVLLVAALLAAQAQALPPNFEQDNLFTLTQPVSLTQLPDERILILQKAGTIRIFDPNIPNPTSSVYLQIPNVNSGGERGLATLAVDPDFESNGYIYVYYTSSVSFRNRISRFTHAGDTADPNSEVVIWQDNENFQSCCHFGGGLGFGPDGLLYLTTGEEFDGPQSTDLGRAGGKIIRINSDGSIPADNPFVDGPGGNLDEIWAYGLRNPFRAFWDLPTSRFFFADVGGNIQQTAYEEINVGQSGGNFGWPLCEGPCSFSDTVQPLFSYDHSSSTPAGGAVAVGFIYRGSQFPPEYQERLFYADFALSVIRTLEFDGAGNVIADHPFDDTIPRIVHLIQGQDGAAYYASFSGSVGRIVFSDGNQRPEITSIDFDSNPGAAPVVASFSAQATDAEDDPLTYRWELGDGTEEFGPQITHLYNSNGPFEVRLFVSDELSTTTSDPQLIQIGHVPTLNIVSPLPGETFRAGDEIVFSATATDIDGTIDSDDFEWEIQFVHNDHTHPTLEGFVGATDGYLVEATGHDFRDQTGFDFIVEVTDSDGLTASTNVVVDPEKVIVQLETQPAGIPFFLDGLSQNAPSAYDTLIDFQHVVSVPAEHCIGNVLYEFDSWSDGGALTHEFVVPENDISLIASFVAAGTCDLPSDGLVLHLEADS